MGIFGGQFSNNSRLDSLSNNCILANIITFLFASCNDLSINSFANLKGGLVIMLSYFLFK